MQNLLVDSNIFLRVFVKTNLDQTSQALKYLKLAKNDKIKLAVLSETIPEIEYVLRKVYKIPKNEIVENILTIVRAAYIGLEKRELWRDAIRIYSENNIDLIDAFLYVNKLDMNFKILSFDKDFVKLDKYAKQNL